jgi:integrase
VIVVASTRGRAADGRSSIYEDKNGVWHGWVTMGVKDNGKPDRRHREAKSKTEVTKKVQELEKLRDSGRAPKAGQRWTVQKWLTHWINEIACPPHVSDNTHAGYEVAVRVHLIPGLGAHRLDRLSARHVEKFTAKMQDNGSKPATAHQAYRTLKTALNTAVREEALGTNPVLLAKPPVVDEEELEPYTVEEIQKLLTLVSTMRNGGRWVIALALGLRQGECLGLKWDDVDLDNGVIWVKRGRLRPKYKHGCKDAKCGKKPGYCRLRIQTNAETGRVKSRAGKRSVGLPAPLVALLKKHKRHQAAEKIEARQYWVEQGYVFTTPLGKPLNPSTDYHQWKAIIKQAGLRDMPLHGARHAAATVLLILGVSVGAVMSIMGWSSAAMLRRYQHVADSIRREVANQVSTLLWDTDDLGDSKAKKKKTKQGKKKGKKKAA